MNTYFKTKSWERRLWPLPWPTRSWPGSTERLLLNWPRSTERLLPKEPGQCLSEEHGALPCAAGGDSSDRAEGGDSSPWPRGVSGASGPLAAAGVRGGLSALSALSARGWKLGGRTSTPLTSSSSRSPGFWQHACCLQEVFAPMVLQSPPAGKAFGPLSP